MHPGPTTPLFRTRQSETLVLAWRVDDSVLQPFLPGAISLDRFQDRAWAILSAGEIQKATHASLSFMPLRAVFVELAFPVQAPGPAGNAPRAGLVTICKTFSSRPLAYLWRRAYRIRCLYRPLRHYHAAGEDVYHLKSNRQWNYLHGQRHPSLDKWAPPADGTLAAFLSDRPWRFATTPQGLTNQHHTTAPRRATRPALDGHYRTEDFTLYGSLVRTMRRLPDAQIHLEGATVDYEPPSYLRT